VFFSLFAFLFSSLANAGIIIGGTRVVYISDHADETISVINKDESLPYLIQAWVDPFDSNDKNKPPFTVIPPVSRLDPLQEKVLRIMKTKGALPEDRESVFWLNVKNIPPASNRKTTNTLEIAIKTRIKLFWRPASLDATPEKVALKMKWHVDNHQLIMENPSPIHINIMDIAVDGKDIPLNIIRPFETLHLPLPASVVGHDVLWHFVDARGAISQDIKIKL
jgi:P pilus assembly chaperone PapD